MQCEGKCVDVLVQIRDLQFVITFYILPTQGADMVLGVQWLQSLGPITIDYSALSMVFSHNHKMVSLKGETNSVQVISSHQLKRLV